jgi:hypothetical protein
MLQQQERVADQALLSRCDDLALDLKRFGIGNTSEVK